MEILLLPPSNYTPLVDFNPSGVLSIKGRSLMIDSSGFYDPLVRWIQELDSETIHFSIEVDYFNTASMKRLMEMLKLLDSRNNVKEFVVYWGFEQDDEDILFKGQILEERLKNARFLFKELTGV
jgi:hypothetical protein